MAILTIGLLCVPLPRRLKPLSRGFMRAHELGFAFLIESFGTVYNAIRSENFASCRSRGHCPGVARAGRHRDHVVARNVRRTRQAGGEAICELCQLAARKSER